MADAVGQTCLHRLGDNVKKHRLISLTDKNEVTIGRSPDVTVCLLSNMISRCHATLKKSDSGTWNIKDNKSLNGVYVNDVRLAANQPRTLQEGDIVQLGIPKTLQEKAEFIFKFHKNLKVKRVRQNSSQDLSENQTENHVGKYPMKRIKLDSDTKQVKSILKRDPTERPESDSRVSSSQPDLGCSDEEADNKGTPRQNNRVNSDKDWSPFQDYKEKVKQQEMESYSKLKEYEAKMAEMQRMLQEKEAAQNEIKNELEEEKRKREHQAKELNIMLKKKEEEMEVALTKKKEEEEKMKEELENQLLNREAQMLEQLQSEKDRLLLEKEKIEENLKLTIEQKDRQLQEELVQQKEKLNGIINKKEAEQRMLESQLNDTKAEKDQQKEAMLQAREDILSNFADLMETELQCSVCNELFVQATSLNCSHAFCAYCIAEWMKVKKECPNCRAPITSSVRSIVLDSYIDKMVEHLSDDLKQQRVELVASRKAEAEKKAEQEKPGTSGNGQRRGRGRGRGRGQGRGRGRNRADPNPPLPEAPPIVIPSDDDIDGGVVTSGDDTDSDHFESASDMSFSDSDDSDDSSGFVRGTSGAYFGGYGRCFRCGSRGHWANGCPYA